LPWFRFRKRKSSDDQQSDGTPELEARPEPELAAAADAAESTDPSKPKRRRGSRGGRGRKKPGPTAGATAPERKDTAETKQNRRDDP